MLQYNRYIMTVHLIIKACLSVLLIITPPLKMILQQYPILLNSACINTVIFKQTDLLNNGQLSYVKRFIFNIALRKD